MEGKFATTLKKLVSFFIISTLFPVYYIHRLPQSTTMEIRIPSNAVGKVMGKGGGNLDNIRRVCFMNLLIFFPHFSLITITSFVSSSLFPT